MQETEKKKRGWVVLLACGFILYFFIAARPMGKELSVIPAWTVRAQGAVGASGSSQGEARAFNLGDRFGYFSPQGRLLSSIRAGAEDVISQDLYGSRDAASGKTFFYLPTGEKAFELSVAGRPFFSAGRLFLIKPDNNGISEFSNSGGTAWSKDTSSLITCFDANENLAVIGGLDGRLVVLGLDGSPVEDFSPGGSRIPIILGCAVSEDSRYIAIVAGIDRQRLVLLERKGEGYRISWHAYLDTDFRRRVFLEFSADSRYLISEAVGGVSIRDLVKGQGSYLALPGRVAALHSAAGDDLFLLLSNAVDGSYLQLLRAPAIPLLQAQLPIQDPFIDRIGRSVFVGLADKILRLDMGEY